MSETSRRILLAEDDRLLRKAAEATLKRKGFTVFTAEDGEEAFRVAQAELPDLVLLDLIMPTRQGFDVLRDLKGCPETARIPVIVLSNLGQEKDAQQAMEGGAIAYIVKAHLSLKELAGRVTQALTGAVT